MTGESMKEVATPPQRSEEEKNRSGLTGKLSIWSSKPFFDWPGTFGDRCALGGTGGNFFIGNELYQSVRVLCKVVRTSRRLGNLRKRCDDPCTGLRRAGTVNPRFTVAGGDDMNSYNCHCSITISRALTSDIVSADDNIQLKHNLVSLACFTLKTVFFQLGRVVWL